MKKSDLQDLYPLSPLQEGLLFQHLYAPDSGAYFEQISFRITGDLDLGAFEASWNQLLERHDILRSAFAYEKAERPMQIVPRQRKIEFAVTDLRHLGDAAQERELAAFQERDRARSFDLRRDVLMRVAVFRAGARDYRVVWSHHHILLDGWSVGILYRELMQIYAARSRGLVPELPRPVPYVRYIEWLGKQDAGGSAAYWRARLAGFAQPTGIPPLAAGRTAAGRAVAYDFIVETTQTEALKRLATGARVTLSTLVQCLWAVLLARYNCSDDLLFGVTASIRPEDLPGSGDLVGLLINTVPVRLRAAPEQPFLAFLQQTQEDALARRPHEHYPLHRIQGEAPLRALFDHLLVFENYPLGRPPQTADGLVIGDIALSEQAHYPLCVVVVPGTDGLRVRLAYDPARYLPQQMERLEGHLRWILGTVLDDPRLPLCAIGILSPAERTFLTAGLNATTTPYPREQTVVELFEAQAAARPAHPAVVCGQVRLSYADLEARANRLAHRLRDDHGIGPDACVGVLLGRSEQAIVAVLAVLKAGGAYVPIDPAYPRRRIDFMLADAHCRVVVTEPAHAWLAGTRPRLTLEAAAVAPEAAAARNPRPLATPTNLAYVMYTSGTTGEPKGVMVPHRAIVRLVKDTNYIALTPAVRILQTGPLTFDASTFEIWGALLNGGTVVTTTEHEILDLEALGRALRDHAITVMWLTASLCNQLVEQDLSLFAGLRELLVGGERLSPVHIGRLRAAHPGLVVINGYGPTENTTFTACCRLDRHYDGDLPIGRPVANTRVYLLDERLEPVPIGVPGRLYTSGDGLARGYLNQPELTAQRFPDCPYEPGGRMYDTGDLARWLPDGNLAFSGRRDDQVKIRGHRIECGEIAQHLLQHPLIRQAAVLPRERADGTRELIAYVVGTGLTTPALRDFLAERLPEYMIPARFAALAALPLTPNGKIDQRALPAADDAGLDHGTVFAPPREGLETTLAAIWAEVLGRGRIGAEDNYFDLGGDSIKAIQIMARLHRLGLRLAIRDFFAHPSIRALAPRLVSATQAIPQGQVAGALPLTPIQRWLFQTVQGPQHHFNHALLLRPLAPLDEPALERALGLLMRHHDALRLTLRTGDGGPLLEHRDTLDLTLERVCIGGADPAARLTGHADQVQRGFDLAAGPLVRALLYRLEDGSERLLLVVHHLVIDGVSWRILLADLAAAYAQACRGEVLRLPAKTHSFKDWAEFLMEQAGGAALSRELPYWRAAERQIAGQRLPYRGGALPAARRLRTLSVALEPQATAELLGSAHQAYRTRGNDLLLTALAIAGEQWHGSSKTVIALESHGRDHAGTLDLSRTVGWFTALFPVTLDLAGAPMLGERIRLVKETLRAVPGNGQGYGVLRYLRPGTGLGTDEPAIAFNYLGDFDQDLPAALFVPASESPGASVSPAVRLPQDLLLAGMVRERRLTLALTFDADRLEETSAAALLAAYVDALHQILAHCRAKPAGELTPSDLTHTGLRLADFDRLLGQLGRAPTEIEDIYPLSPMQEGLLFHSLYDAGSTAFFQQMHYRIAGALDPVAFQAAWDLLAQRHAVLRTLFAHERLERPLQVVLKSRPMAFAYEDRRDTGDAQEYVERLMVTERRRPFDLARDRLMRIALVRAGTDRWHLLWTFHHILLDGWCLGILYRELLEAYRALRAGQAAVLAPVHPYASYLAWLARQDEAAAGRCWRDDLAGFHTPTGVPAAPAAGAGTAATEPVATDLFYLSADLTRALQATAVGCNVTLGIVVQALWAILLSRLTGCDDLVFGTAVAGRPETIGGIENMVGLFMNTVPVRVRTPPRLRFRDLLRRIQGRALALKPHEWYPLARIQAASALKQRLFDHILVYENYPLEAASGASGGQAELRLSLAGRYRETNYVFSLAIDPGERLTFHMLYDPVRYAPGQIAEIGRLLVHLAFAVTADTDPLLGELAALPDESTGAAPPVRLVPGALASAFEQHLRRVLPGHRAGAAVAVTIRDRRGQRVPDGTRGIIHLDHCMPSGFSGRRLGDHRMEITEEPADLLIADGTALALDGLIGALRRHPDLEDHALLKLQAKSGSRFVLALAVGRRALEAERLAEDLGNQVEAAVRGRLAVMVVPALPLDAEGRLDRARVLAAIPVCEPGFATAALEAQILAELPQLADVAIVLETGIAPVPRLHIHDLLRSHRAYAAVSAPEADGPQTPDEPTAGRDAPPLAYADGGPVEFDPAEPRTMVEALYRAARDYGHRGTVYVNAQGEEHYQSYADLLYEARCLLGGLQAQGVKAGDTVILQQGSLYGHLTGFWACILGGIRPVTVATSPTYAQKTSVVNKLYNAWRLLEQPLIFASPDLVEPIEGLNALFCTSGIRAIAAVGYPPVDSDYRAAPDDIAFYQLTSGSTGIPKCIQERHKGIYYHVYGSVQFNGYTRDDVYLTWPPSDHVGALITLYIKALYLGVQQVAVETDLILRDPLTWLDLLEAHRVTFTWSPNFGYKLLAEQLKATERRWDLSCVRFFMNAAEQVTLPVVEEFLRLVRPFGVPERALQPAYGMAETCTAMQYKNDFSVADGFHWIEKSSLKGQLRRSADPGRDAVSFVKLGPPIPGVQIRIVDAHQQVLPQGRIGSLHVRGEVITPGYLNNPQANAETLVGDGWLNTGDLGFILDGELSITGRQKEIIIVRAANFYCYEIEDIVNRVPGVEPTFAGATAIDDPAAGSEGLAIVFSPRPDADLIAVNRAIRAQIAMECGINPSYVIPLDRERFPKTTSGKIQRLELREAIEQGHFDATIREIDLALANERTLPGWFFTSHWRRRPLDGRCGESAAALAPVCLLIADDPALESALRPAALVQSGTGFARPRPGCYTVDPERPEHYARLLDDLRESGVAVDTVVYALGYGGGAGAPAPGQHTGLELETWHRDTFGLLALIRALAVAGPRIERLLVLARGAALVAPDDAPGRVNGSLRGIVRTLAQEWPGLACRLLDLADGTAGEHAETIRTELGCATPDLEVAYRDGERFVPCLRRVDFNGLERQPIPFAAEGLYLITGGLGGIGSEVARVLLVHYGCHLILTGRSDLAPAPEPAAAFNRLRRLGRGTVEYHAVDAADRTRLAALIGAAEAAGGRRLGGILHLAGESGAAPGQDPEALHLVNVSLAVAERVCHAKVAGTAALLGLVEERPDAFFIGVSSVNGVFGGTGTGAYAAANGFLDGAVAAFNRRHPERPRAYGLCFSRWDGVGMSRDRSVREAARAKGFEAISLAQGIASFLVGIEFGLPQPIVGLDPDNRSIQARLEQAPIPEQELTAYYTLREGAEADDAAVLARIDAIARTWHAAVLNDPT